MFQTTTGFALTNGQALTVTGPVTDAASIQLATTGDLNLAGVLTAPAISLTANASSTSGGGGILQSGGTINAASELVLSAATDIAQTDGVISANRVSGSAGFGFNLTATGNAIGELGTAASTRGFALTDSQTLRVTGAVSDQISIQFTIADALSLSGSLTAPVMGLTATGPITQTGGSIAANTLRGSAAGATLGGANAVGTLAGFTTTGDFAFNDTNGLAVTGALQAGGAASLAVAGDLSLQADILAPTLNLSTTGVIAQTTGSIQAATLATLSAVDATLTGSNAIGTLGQFAVSGTFALKTGGDLVVAGPGSAPRLTLETDGAIRFAGNVGSSETLTVNAGGAVVQTGGTLAAGTLAGTAVTLASFGASGTANIATIGPFTLTGSASAALPAVAAGANPAGTAVTPPATTLNLIDSTPLTVASPISAGAITLSAPGTLTLLGGQISTETANLSVTAAPNAGAQLLQTGTTSITALGGAAPSLTLALPTSGGAVTLQRLDAAGTNLALDLQTGTATGVIAVASLQVNGSGGSAALTGAVAGIADATAATISTIAPRLDPAYRLNGCTIGAASCAPVGAPGFPSPTPTPTPTPAPAPNPIPPIATPIPPPTGPTLPPPLVSTELAAALLTPKSFLDTVLGNVLKPNLFTADLIAIGILRDPADPELLLPNISDRDY